jgi:hypothetical protein
MKLRLIAEARLSGSRTAIRDAGAALGDLIDYLTDTGPSDASAALAEYLKTPDPRTWENHKWIIDAALQQALAANDPELKDRMEQWANLKTLTAPVAVAALYDIDKQQLKGTPLQKIGLSRPMRDKMKLAMGPQGYVGTFANASHIPQSRLQELMKTTAKNGAALAKASKKDLPAAKPTPRF